MLGLMASACLAELHGAAQLLLPWGGIPMRMMDSPAWPFTLSSAQNCVASAAVILLSTHWLHAPKPLMTWCVAPAFTEHAAACMIAGVSRKIPATSPTF